MTAAQEALAEEILAGGCLCGAVRFEAEGPPRETTACHCRMCQRNSGTVFAVYASYPSERVRFLAGRPKLYRSSSFAERGFCAACGTPLTFQYLAGPEDIGLTLGSFDEPARLAPQSHDGIESWVPWLKMDDGLPRRRTEDDPEFLERRSYAAP